VSKVFTELMGQLCAIVREACRSPLPLSISSTSPSSSFRSLIRLPPSDYTLLLLTLDPWILNFTTQDHAFLHHIRLFSTLYRLITRTAASTGLFESEEDKQSRKNVHRFAKTLFRFLAVICFTSTSMSSSSNNNNNNNNHNHNKVSKIHNTFLLVFLLLPHSNEEL
jgi:hypothetical protein